MQRHDHFWRSTMKTTSGKYLGIEFKVFSIIGIIGSIATAIFAPVDLWGKLAIGYGAMAIICLCLMLGAWDTWKALRNDTKELLDLYFDQSYHPRNYLHPIRLIIEGLEKENTDIIDVNVHLISQLVEGLRVTRIVGRIMVKEITQDFEFTKDAPYHFSKLLNSSDAKIIRQQVILTDSIKKRISEIRKDRDSNVKFEIIIYRDTGDLITISQPNDVLMWKLKNETA